MTAAVADLDGLFAVLASPPRRAIISHLGEGPTTTPDLGRRFSFSKQALNQHVVALERAGLIERARQGRVHTVALRPERLDEVTRWVDQVRAAWSANLDRLGDVLTDTEGSP